MENRKHLLSIVIATYNASSTIERCLDSVRRSKRSSIELIIIDGGSSDDTLSILHANNDIVDYVLSEPDTGIYDAWNKALSVAKGEWIMFLGADDVLVESGFDSILEHAVQHPYLDYISGRVNLIDEKERILRVIGSEYKWPIFRRYMNVAHVGSLHSARLYERYGTYDTSYKICGDYEFLLRSKQDLRAGYVADIVANMSVGGVSSGSSSALAEARRAKHETGSRGVLVNILEHYIAHVKLLFRKMVKYG